MKQKKQQRNKQQPNTHTKDPPAGFSLVTQLVNHSNIFSCALHLVLNSICNERRNQRNQRNQPNRQWCISEVREEYQVTCFKSYV